MNKQIYTEIRKNLNRIYEDINNIINLYEYQKENLTEKQKILFLEEIVRKLADISSIVQVDVFRLDTTFSIDTTNTKNHPSKF